jgi:hypothetical protein
MKTGRGTAMHLVSPRIQFVPGGKTGRPEKLAAQVVEVRKFLQTDMSVQHIAEQLGVSAPCLMQFIRRRNICDLHERKKFISRSKLKPRD